MQKLWRQLKFQAIAEKSAKISYGDAFSVAPCISTVEIHTHQLTGIYS